MSLPSDDRDNNRESEHDLQRGARSVQKELEHWFQSNIGRNLIASQRPVIEHAIRRQFGVHLAEIGVSHRIPVGNSSNLGHHFHVLPAWEPDMPNNVLVSDSNEIAIDHDMVDLVILHHALDFSADPHQTLREASRILKSSGNLLVVGFNPFSLWGIRRLLSRTRAAPWNNRFISGSRVEDWLNLLDFKVSGLQYHFYAPPVNNQRAINGFRWLDKILNTKVPLGAYYTIMAQKQVGGRIRIAPRWRNKAKVVGLPLANRVDAKKTTD